MEIIHGLQQIPHLIEEYLEDVGPIMDAVELVKDAKSVFLDAFFTNSLQ